MKQDYVLCIDNKDYSASLEAFKIYRMAPAQPGDPVRGMTRVVDESGEDYLFPSKYFLPLSFKEPVRRILSSRFRSLRRQRAAA